MSNTYKYIVAAFLACAMWACESNDLVDYFASKYFVDSTEAITIGGKVDEVAEITITADCSWTIEKLPTWLTATPTSGSGETKVVLKCTESNPDPKEKRNGEFTVSADNGKILQKVAVSQDPGPVNIQFVDEIAFDCVGGSKSYPLSCQGSWTILHSDWIDVKPASGVGDTTIVVEVKNYRGTTPLNGELQIKATGQTKQVAVTQSEYVKMLQLSSNLLTQEEGNNNSYTLSQFSKEGGSATILLESSDDWSIAQEDLDKLTWAKISPVSGEGGAFNIYIDVPKNESGAHESTIMFKNSVGLWKNVTLSQQSADTYLTPLSGTSLSFSADGGSAQIVVESSNDITISGINDNSWVKVTNKSNSGTIYTIDVVADPNKQTAKRNATIIIENGVSEKIIVTAEQAAFESKISINPDMLTMSNRASEANITVTCNASWDAVSDHPDWCTVEKTNGGVTVKVTDNNSTEPRNATVTVKLSDGSDSKTCTVTQPGGKKATISGENIFDVTKYEFSFGAHYESETKVLEYGVCVSDHTTQPDITNKAVSGTPKGNETSFSLTVTGLQSARTYYVCGYVTNEIGTEYTKVYTVTTEGAIPNEDDNTPPSTR